MQVHFDRAKRGPLIWICLAVLVFLFILMTMSSSPPAEELERSPNSRVDRVDRVEERPLPNRNVDYRPNDDVVPNAEINMLGSYCDGELMRFPAYQDGQLRASGNAFNCDFVKLLRDWKIDSKSHYVEKPVKDEDVVFVSYASSNHFSEALKGVKTLRSQRKNKIIFYDIGLAEGQSKLMQEAGDNIEVRKLDFKKYPQFTSNLGGYHFKPLIAAEVYSSIPAFWLIDSSIRFKDIQPIYNKINEGFYESYMLGENSSHSIYAATNPAMYSYLPIAEKQAQHLYMFGAAGSFIRHSDFSRNALKWYVLCALTQNCMAPPNSPLMCFFGQDRFTKSANCHRYVLCALTQNCMAPPNSPLMCFFGQDRFTKFANCHRFDQSAMSIILSSLREMQPNWKETKDKDRLAFSENVQTMRGDT